MFGKNKKLTLEKGDGSSLKVKSIFKTLQGEGSFVGVPSVFIRLTGCNLACTFCDTEFDDGDQMKLDDILAKVKDLSQPTTKLIVITGGEPFRQPISPLCDKLIEAGYKIQIETNGTLFREIHKDVFIICSPKNESGKNDFPIDPRILKRLTAIKILISGKNEKYSPERYSKKIPEWQTEDKEIFVQAIDEYDLRQNKINLELAIELCQRYNCRLSLQTHKITGLE